MSCSKAKATIAMIQRGSRLRRCRALGVAHSSDMLTVRVSAQVHCDTVHTDTNSHPSTSQLVRLHRTLEPCCSPAMHVKINIRTYCRSLQIHARNLNTNETQLRYQGVPKLDHIFVCIWPSDRAKSLCAKSVSCITSCSDMPCRRQSEMTPLV